MTVKAKNRNRIRHHRNRALNRAQSEIWGAGITARPTGEAYSQDANGCLASVTVALGQLTSITANGASMSFTSLLGKTLAYDAAGRLSEATAVPPCPSGLNCAGAQTTLSRFNGWGQRFLRDTPNAQSVFSYGTEGFNLLSETTRNLSTSALSTTEHIWLPTASGPMPIAAVIDGVHYAVHADHLNTPRRLTDGAKAVKWQWPYSGFGEIGAQATPAAGQAPLNYSLRYPGQIDDSNGLFYNWHRFYDPRVGRYTKTDPIGLEGGWNRIGYVGGNPMSKTDPTGLLENFTFNRPSGTLTHECGCPGDVSNPAFSGNRQYTNRPEFESMENHGPIPAGTYYIVEPYHYSRVNGSVFFKLYRDDGVIDDQTILPNGQPRGQFRFHPGIASNGCVTVSSRTNAWDWYRIQDRLLRTRTSTIPGTDIIYYGTVRVK
jgi:RHS repeat-associated protein